MNTKYIVWVGGIDDHYASEEEAWDSDLYGEGVRLIKTEWYDWHEQKEVNEVEGE